TYRNLGHSAGNIVGCHRLEKHRWQMHFAFYDRNISEALEEFEKLRRVDDRVRNQRPFDQRLLRHVGAEVSTLEQTLSAYHRQRYVMSNACVTCAVEHSTALRLEELQ